MRLILSLLLVVFTSIAYAQPYSIDKATITFEFPAKEVSGTIEGFKSTSRINWEAPEESVFAGSVEAATLDTNNGLRNWSLRGSKYFNVKEYPKLSYQSNRVVKKGDLWMVEGMLTIKGIRKPFTIEFNLKDNQLVGKGSLYTTDYNIKIKKNKADNLVNVTFNFPLVR